MLQSLHCSYKHVPDSAECMASRKTSCSLVDLEHIRQEI